MNFLGSLKQFFDSGCKTDLLVFTAKKMDNSNKLGRALATINPLHLKLAATSASAEYMCNALDPYLHFFLNSPALPLLKKKMAEDLSEHGGGLLDSDLKSSRDNLLKFIGNPSQAIEESKLTLANESGTITLEEEEEEDDWIELPDPEKEKSLGPDELAEYLADKQHRTQIKLEKLLERYAVCKKWNDCFRNNFAVDDDIRTMIRNKDSRLFLNTEFSDRLKIFGKGTFWSRGADPTKYVTKSTKEAYENLVMVDKYNSAKNPNAIMLVENLWNVLNNLVLFTEFDSMVSDKALDQLMTTATQIYADLLNNKISDLKVLANTIMTEVYKAMPQLEGSNQANKLGDFVIEALFQNNRQFKNAFNWLFEMIPSEAKTMITESFGVELNQNMLQNMLETQLNQVNELRARKENGENIQLLTKGNLDELLARNNIDPSTIQ